MPYLVIKCNGQKVKTHRLVPDNRIRIGRGPDNDIVIDDSAVSTVHAEIEPEGEYFFITDFNSRNGTFVNKELVISRRLVHGDVIAIGNHSLLFGYGKDESRPAPVSEQNYQATMMMDTEDHRARLARSVAEITETDARKKKVATLNFLSGDREAVPLDRERTVIGKDPEADIRVSGWRLDKNEAVIEKREDGYYLCPCSKKKRRVKLNYQSAKTEMLLSDFDVIDIGATTIQIHY